MKRLAVSLAMGFLIAVSALVHPAGVSADDESKIAKTMEWVKRKRNELADDIVRLRLQLKSLERIQSREQLERTQERSREERRKDLERWRASMAELEPHLSSTTPVEIDGRQLTPGQIKTSYREAQQSLEKRLNSERRYPHEIRLWQRRRGHTQSLRQRDHMRVHLFQIESMISDVLKKRIELRDLRTTEIIHPDRNFDHSLDLLQKSFKRNFDKLEEEIKLAQMRPRLQNIKVPAVAWRDLRGWSRLAGSRETLATQSGPFRVKGGWLRIDPVNPDETRNSRLFFRDRLESYDLWFRIRVADEGDGGTSEAELPSLLIHWQDPSGSRKRSRESTGIEFQLQQRSDADAITAAIDSGTFREHNVSWDSALVPESGDSYSAAFLQDFENVPYEFHVAEQEAGRKGEWTTVRIRVFRGVRIHVELGDDAGGYAVDHIQRKPKDGTKTSQQDMALKIESGYFGIQAGGRPVEIRDVWLRQIDD